MSREVRPDETWRMEQFSKAYVKAVGSVVGCSVQWSEVDNDSVDGTMRKRTVDTPVRSPALDFQLKCTWGDYLRSDGVHYPLELKNYNELRSERVLVPRILVVVLVPADVDLWAEQDENQLLIRKCGYWVSLRGMPEVGNESSRTVVLPRSQILDRINLESVFSRLEMGGLP